ncbi:serine hydrolase-like protein 2 isoform X4 [Sceloporus undulatus]|uniref:serine hydrolase-like protein 2 isoform X4 n=1 Tax=Sceloporus undulatus TaxID=8520 RepID=UPI001C4C1311|nr:serine hydrolase-like protein 2 isoform X4 [Sceloporus undulatus]
MAGLVSELKFLVPWGHIAAKAWGSPQGRPVLCLHGWLDNANTFSKLIPLLPKDCYYMALDFAGHGLSSHRPAGCPYYLIDHVSDVRRVAASLKWNRFSLMGHSMGGTVAGMFACIFPELVDKLILVESCGFYPSPQEWEKILYGHRIVIDNLLNVDGKQHQALRVRSSEKALQRLLEANNDLTEESGKILLERGATKVPGGLVYNRDIRLLSHTSHPTHIEYQVNYVKKIQADVLMIIAQDGIFTKQSPEHLSEYSVIIQEAFRASRKEHFQYAEVSGNHFVHLNEPEVVAGIVSTFLNNNQNLKAKL